MTVEEAREKFGNKKVHEIGDRVFTPTVAYIVSEGVVKGRRWKCEGGEWSVVGYMLFEDNEKVGTNAGAVFDSLEGATNFIDAICIAVEEREAGNAQG